MTTAVGPDPAALTGQQVDAEMSAVFAELNRQAWQLCRYVLACSRARADTLERITGRPRAGKIVAASCGWSEGFAASRIEFAHQVLERLPRLGEQMASGRLEERKAAVIVDVVADLDDEQARRVVDEVLADAPRLPYTALRTRASRVAAAVDPEWAERRRAAAIARRRVALRSAPSGATELCGLDLPEDPAQNAHDRIVALGRAVRARLKRAGVDGVSVGQVESEVMLTLTGPAGAGLYDLDVVDHVTAVLGGPTDGSDHAPGPDDPGPDDPGPERPEPDGPPAAPSTDPHTADPHTAGPPADSPDRERPRPPVVAFGPRTVLRLDLRTLLGLDQRPGELPGRGMIPAGGAVLMAWARVHCRWRLVLHDEHGRLDHVLSVRPSTTGPPPAGGRHRHQTVEVTASTHDLDRLAATPPGDAVPGDAPGLLRRAAAALARERARPADEHPARTRAEAHRRVPSGRLRDWVTARDRTCRGPGCTTDATACDLDHTLAVTAGGRTAADDLGPMCRRDHLLKHDADLGWTVVQTAPGRFAWTSPTGRVHLVDAEPYRRLPDPVPRTGPTPAADDHVPHPRPPGDPRPNRHGHVTDAAHATADRIRRRTHPETGAPEPDPFPEEPPF